MIQRRATISRAIALMLVLGGCGAVGAGRAIDEAEEIVARLPCAPDALAPGQTAPPCNASAKTLYLAVSARAYLSEARRRAHHADHAQAERFAVLARKSAEEALRNQEGP